MFKSGKIIPRILLCLCIAAALTGCSTFTRQKKEETTLADNEDSLEDGEYYILHKSGKKSTFTKVCMGDASYDTSEDAEISDTPSSTAASRTLRYTDDYDEIPTLYDGDSLIFYSTRALDDGFVLERFESFGWTFGITGMTKMNSDRYSFLTGGDDDPKNIDKKSDAAQLIKAFPDSKLVIDDIGGTKVRSNNVTRGGSITGGLKRGDTYSVNLYAGTEHYQYNLKADTYVMTSMAAYQDSDFEFLKSKILKINIPSWYNSGYYNINGKGVFRYVKGDSYNDSTDFNIPNENPDSETYTDDTYYYGSAEETSTEDSAAGASTTNTSEEQQ